MARLPACCSFCRNLPPAGEDELAGASLIESSGMPTPICVILRVFTPALATAPATALSLDKKLCKQFMKAYLEAKVPGQIEVDLEPRKQPFKARFLSLTMVICT